MPEGMARRMVAFFLRFLGGFLCCFLFASGRLGECEVGVGVSHPSDHISALLGSQVSERAMEVSRCDPRHYKAGGCALFGLLGGLKRV